MKHQRRDDYWKHGSICENYEDIQCPVMAVSGWADGYSNSVFRLLKHLKVPRMGLVGPWSHRYPHDGLPGPAIGFLQECLRWWDQWLKNKQTGIDKEPALKAWVQESIHPFTSYQERPGYWIGLDQWPSNKVENKKYILCNDHTLQISPAKKEESKGMALQSPLNLGMFAGKWCSYSAPPDLPGDQRDEDGGALIFTSKPLEEDLHIIGMPVAQLQLKVNRPVAMIAVRLSDVAPDGKTTRVTFSVLNLCHRESHEQPKKLRPGEKYDIQINLNEIGHVFPAGNKIRLSISTSYFPLAWTPPQLVMMHIFTQESFLSLPVIKGQGDGEVRFKPAEGAKPSSQKKIIHAPRYKWNVHRDLITDEASMEVDKNQGTFYLKEIDLEISQKTNEKYSVKKDSLDSVKAETSSERVLKRENWNIKTSTHTILTSDEENFYLHATLDAYESDKRIFSKIWNEKIPRDHV